VTEAFPGMAAGPPGFETTLNVQDLPAGAAVGVLAVFGDGGRSRFAELRLGGRDGARAAAP
jgi:hypothetical protein